MSWNRRFFLLYKTGYGTNFSRFFFSIISFIHYLFFQKEIIVMNFLSSIFKRISLNVNQVYLIWMERSLLVIFRILLLLIIITKRYNTYYNITILYPRLCSLFFFIIMVFFLKTQIMIIIIMFAYLVFYHT